ncbi:galactose oxidase [Geosmithia morbida]|uniref:Galactose oxidase n=1 Tax=Geosmithia morbida TaxID=1094350 RepID=A0A9P4YYW1_9HYPO|nr:galactose oxidase [Geosmithia morbida]KAF4124286.1 galactose oxidase [Geosmithia morbida]
MKLQWVHSALLGLASANHAYLEEAMRGERVVSGHAVYDRPSWEPQFRDESPPYKGIRVTREDWKMTCSSGHDSCNAMIDGSNATAWTSEKAGEHLVTIDLQETYSVGALVVLPKISITGQDGLITEHKVFLSRDAENWGEPVAYGMWPDSNRMRMSAFELSQARYVRLVAQTAGDSTVTISEINVYANLYSIDQDPSKGVWGPTLDLPVVPAAGAQEGSGQIMLWSSWDDDQFHSTPGGKTAMALWDFRTNQVSKRVVTDSQHDMFCPGIAIDGTGMMVVTGGNDAAQTSLFDARKNSWEAASTMNMERGYQASATLSDGRVFVIGGSWAGGSSFDKDGEVYDPATRSWTRLPGAKVEPMYTRDMEGPWRADNHGWLFGWTNQSIFQAGPSLAMNWYSVDGEGDVLPAGEREGGEDSMSGNAVMFDAVAGKILTMGGSPDYDKSDANGYAHVITLGEFGDEPVVERAGENGEMTVPRVFHTSAVLPDGTVFIVGGQTFGQAFNEEGVQFVPELYDPRTNRFSPLQRNNIIRVYHSLSILIPDGRVLTGGGGLCGNCSANHYDAQIYTPAYLLNHDGSLRDRPEFTSEIPDEVEVGSVLQFNASDRIREAALIRISSTTHTVNTDQRRVPLDVVPSRDSEYEFQAELPESSGVLIPGWWMLFIIDDKGTPSVAEMLMVKIEDGADSTSHGHAPLRVDQQEEECEHEQNHLSFGSVYQWMRRTWKPTSFFTQILRRG